MSGTRLCDPPDSRGLLHRGVTGSVTGHGVTLAWQVLRKVGNDSTPKVLRAGLTLGALLIPIQILVGDLHGLNTLQHQPQKVAAMEGIWQTERGAPLLLFAVPNSASRSNDFAIGIPRLGSLILTHELDGEIKGLNEFRDAHPAVAPVFYAFRVMVGTGMLMLLASWAGVWLYRRARWQPHALPRPLLWLLTGMTFAGWVATVAGLAATSQGWMLGHYITGLQTGWAYTAFCATIAVALPAAYVLLGACWLILKTEGELQTHALRWARIAWLPVVLGIVMVGEVSPRSPGRDQ